MATPSRYRIVRFQIIGQNSVNPNWNGLPCTLQVNQNVNMLQTPNGTMVFAYFNQASQNNQGTLSVTSGGSQPVILQVPANALQPSVWMNNWRANNLSVTNISQNANTPVWIAAFGPGLPGQVAVALPANGTRVPLAPAQSAQGNALPQWMQLVMQSNTPSLTIVAFIGGPPDSSGNNGYVVAVNASSDTGPGTGNAPTVGYYATTTGNSYAYPFNWGSSLVYVVNMSPATGSSAQVLLRSL
ncbi:MAG: hypothetical protein ACRERE_10805 [Candidatus Entotheonellia bacterium]